jgi:hypothetical protein
MSGHSIGRSPRGMAGSLGQISRTKNRLPQSTHSKLPKSSVVRTERIGSTQHLHMCSRVRIECRSMAFISIAENILSDRPEPRESITTFRAHSITYFCIIPRNERKESQRVSWRIAIASTSKKLRRLSSPGCWQKGALGAFGECD